MNRKRYPVHEIGGNLKPRRAAYVQIHEAPVDDDGEVADWAKWQTGRRANPLVDYNPHLGPALRDELANAKRDGRWTE